MIEAAAAAPDHGRLRPSRFIALRGEAKEAFGEVLERGYLRRCEQTGTEPVPEVAAKERTKLGRAPLVLVAATVQPAEGSRAAASRVPWEERIMSTAAAVQNLLLAATSLGYGSMWRTGDTARDPVVKEALGLATDDEIAGFIYLGTPSPEVLSLAPNQPDADGLLVDWRPVD